MNNNNGLTNRQHEGLTHAIKDYLGYFTLPQALSNKSQYELAFLTLTKYCENPHITNVDDANHFHDDANDNNVNKTKIDKDHNSSSNTSSISMFNQWKIEQKEKQELENNANDFCV